MSLIKPKETISRVKPGYLTFLSSLRISLGLGIIGRGDRRFSVCGARLSMQVTHVIIATLSEKPNEYATGLGVSADRRREAGPRILYSAGGKSKPPEVLLTAVNELQRGLRAMLGRELI